MAKHLHRKSSSPDRSISWERVRSIFGNPQPPRKIWQKQFDGCDDKLRELSQTPQDQIDFEDMWYYHHDMAYVELQPELFAYLFPVCLMDWHNSLMSNVACSHGDSEFHYGLWRGNVLEKMLTDEHRSAVFDFFHDSFLMRLDAERNFDTIRNRSPTFCGWRGRFNSLGIVLPNLETIWNAWWQLETPGRAVAAIQYGSALMYPNEENPLFRNSMGSVGSLDESDARIYDAGWLNENREFLSEHLTVDFLNTKLPQAVARLSQEPEWSQARQIEQDLHRCQRQMMSQITVLIECVHGPTTDEL